jgi:hypothetical protein
MAANTGDAAKELKQINKVRDCGVNVAGFRAVTDTWKEVRGRNKYLCIPMEFSGPTVRDCILSAPKAGPRLAIAFNILDIMQKLHSKKVFIPGILSISSLLLNDWLITSLLDFTLANLLVKVDERVKKYSKDEMYDLVIKPQIKYAKVKQGFMNKNGEVIWNALPKDSKPVPERLCTRISLAGVASNDGSLDIIDVYQGGLNKFRKTDSLQISININNTSKSMLIVCYRS